LSKNNPEEANDKKFETYLEKELKEKVEKKGNNNSENNGNGDGNINGNGDSTYISNGSVNSNINNKSSKKPTTFKLSKEKKEPKKIKRTYYIYEEDDEKLNELARHSGKDKSELVRIAIGFLYDNAEVE
jgi:protein tyrosine phosphatase